MPRTARAQSESGYYHVMLRGNERRDIFLDDEDRERYLHLLAKQVTNESIDIIAYCLMDNHLHLLIHDKGDKMASAMRSIGVSYAGYFNKKNNRIGHLFQDRFKSEAIEDDTYLFAALRYIHQNPVKAGMCSKAEEYTWSSDKYYRHPELKTFVDTDILLSISKNKVAAVPEYIRLMEIPEPKEYIDVAKTPLIPQEITLLVEKELRQAGIDDMRNQGARAALAKVVHILCKKHGLSMRKIAGELGISKSSVQNIISGK